MFAHVRKWLPWQERTKRKKAFLDKLKGIQFIRIHKNAPVGSVFIVLNDNTGDVDTFCHINTNKWTSVKSGNSTVRTYSRRSLEKYLSKLIQEADNKKLIHFINDGDYIERIKPK